MFQINENMKKMKNYVNNDNLDYNWLLININNDKTHVHFDSCYNTISTLTLFLHSIYEP